MGSVLSYGDAISNDIVEIDQRLGAWGFESRIYGSNIEAAPTPKAQRDVAYEPFLDNPDDLLIYHYSAYCENIPLFQRSKNRKILIYHNITPAEYFRPYNALYETLCLQGRGALPALRDCDLALGDSEYNRQELVEVGFEAERTGVLPIFLNFESIEQTQRNEGLYRQLKADGITNILFVGRITPNKAYEDLIKIFHGYHRHINPRSRLVLAGARFLPQYDAVLDALVNRLGLQHAVLFTNRIPLRDMISFYQAADLFLCASQHEGFCVPLLEAMHFGLPVLARATSAIPHTLGGAGIQFHKLDYPVLSETIALLLEDQALRQQVIASQRRRLADFALHTVEETLRACLERVGVATPAVQFSS
jgi:glycosyltransferase involved in cell wall biosynthesis